jgi:hypothetical protein
MRLSAFTLAMSAVMAASPAFAHGPQIQITNDNNKIVTRELHLDGPYSTALTSPKTVYVMPVLPFDGVWYSRPNGEPSATLPGVPRFPSGPGLAYGYDLADGGPQAFAPGSMISMVFIEGLKSWNGVAFEDAGATQLKAFRGSDANITSPPGNFTISSDDSPRFAMSLPPVEVGYGADEAEVHNSIRYAVLGDGSSPTSFTPDGIYLARMVISNSDRDVLNSDPYMFVLPKNASSSALAAAVQSLGVAPRLVQWIVPEPTDFTLAVLAMFTAFGVRGRCTRRKVNA